MRIIDELMRAYLADCEYEPVMEMLGATSGGKRLRARLILKIVGVDEETLRSSPSMRGMQGGEKSPPQEAVSEGTPGDEKTSPAGSGGAGGAKPLPANSPLSFSLFFLKNDPVAAAFHFAALIELVHLASLLHDDIIDEAELRRGAASVNAAFGAKNALMLGDIIYAAAFAGLVRLDAHLAELVAEAVARLAVGELMDVRLGEIFNTNETAYLTMIEAKTAALIAAAAAGAAYLSQKSSPQSCVDPAGAALRRSGGVGGVRGRPPMRTGRSPSLRDFSSSLFFEKNKEKDFFAYGQKLGLAFQIIDDLLDITGEEGRLGKPIFADLAEGKMTLPYLYLYQALDEAGQARLRGLWRREPDAAEREWLRGEFTRAGALQKTGEAARQLGEEALAVIKKYKNQELEKIIQEMIIRDL